MWLGWRFLAFRSKCLLHLGVSICPLYFVVTDCDEAPCMNGGTCLARENELVCVCPVHYTGQICQTCEYYQELLSAQVEIFDTLFHCSKVHEATPIWATGTVRGSILIIHIYER